MPPARAPPLTRSTRGADFESRADPNNKEQMSLLEASRANSLYPPRPRSAHATQRLRLLRRGLTRPRARGLACARAAQEMRAHTDKLAAYRKHEDPRLSFTTPEFKEASRTFSDNFKARRGRAGAGARPAEDASQNRSRRAEPATPSQKNFGKPVEYGMVKRYPVRAASGCAAPRERLR